MIALSRAVVVEGKYDRARLSSVVDAPILQTDGFGVFRDRATRTLLRRYAKERGLIVLTDSDAAGRLIRGHIESIVGKDADVVHLYIPKVRGKERRKTAPSKEGLLGVEGMEDEVLLALTISALDNPVAKSAKAQLANLRGSDAHFSVIISDEDEKILRRLGINVSCEPQYEVKRLYHKF